MKNIISTLLLAILLSSCSWFGSLKPKETFYCKINGIAFRPEKDNSPIGGIGTDPLKVTWDKTYNWLYIQARETPQLLSISIKLSPNEFVSEKEYLFENDLKKTSANYYLDYTLDPTKRELLISNSGKIIITKIDGYNLSGTFEFTCKSAKTGIEYKITNGEFNNISYY